MCWPVERWSGTKFIIFLAWGFLHKARIVFDPLPFRLVLVDRYVHPALSARLLTYAWMVCQTDKDGEKLVPT